MNGRRAGREAAVPHTRPSALRAARSAGLLARRNRSVWLIRSRPSVVTITGPLCCVTLVRGTASGRPGQAPNARSGRRTAWKPLSAKRWASGCVSANEAAASFVPPTSRATRPDAALAVSCSTTEQWVRCQAIASRERRLVSVGAGAPEAWNGCRCRRRRSWRSSNHHRSARCVRAIANSAATASSCGLQERRIVRAGKHDELLHS